MRFQLGLNRAVVAMACAAFATCAWSQSSFPRAIEGLLSQMPPAESRALVEKLNAKQETVKLKLGQQQLDLDATRLDQRNPEQAKAFILEAKQAAIQDTRKSYLILETAKRAVKGEEIAKPLAVYLPDVVESIASLSNPALPLCGRELTYRGDSNQVSWNETLDRFLSKYGDGLGAVGRIEIDKTAYRQGPNGPEQFVHRVPVGTGFAIAPRKIATAGHVAATFWDFESKKFRDGVVAVHFNTGGEHKFKCPAAEAPTATRRLAGVSLTRYEPSKPAIDNVLDFAVIDLAEAETSLERALPIAKISPTLSSFVMVIGYPADDPRIERETWRTMMLVPVAGGMFPVTDIKRISPGMIVPTCSNGREVHVPHNATTLNRSSGAPIISVETGEVVGIQVAGFRDLGGGELYCNLGLRSNAPEVSLR